MKSCTEGIGPQQNGSACLAKRAKIKEAAEKDTILLPNRRNTAIWI